MPPSEGELADDTVDPNPYEWMLQRRRGALSDGNPRPKDKAPPLDIAVVNSSVTTNLENAARRTRRHLVDTIRWKDNKYRGSFPPNYSLFLLARSKYGEVGSDV